MSGSQEVTYVLDFEVRRRGRQKNQASSGPSEPAEDSIPRIARLMALAIRLEGLIREGLIRDYAELARLGGVTRARMSQIVKLLLLAPDIQEQLLFLPSTNRLNERNLRPIVKRVDWEEQRRMFQRIQAGCTKRIESNRSIEPSLLARPEARRFRAAFARRGESGNPDPPGGRVIS